MLVDRRFLSCALPTNTPPDDAETIQAKQIQRTLCPGPLGSYGAGGWLCLPTDADSRLGTMYLDVKVANCQHALGWQMLSCGPYMEVPILESITLVLDASLDSPSHPLERGLTTSRTN